MANKKRYLVTIKLIRRADSTESITRWAECTTFDIKYRDRAESVGWSVQELPDDDKQDSDKEQQ